MVGQEEIPGKVDNFIHMELGLRGGGVRKTSIVLATPFECSGIPFSMVSGFCATYINTLSLLTGVDGPSFQPRRLRNSGESTLTIRCVGRIQ